jgi:hypothetical protein
VALIWLLEGAEQMEQARLAKRSPGVEQVRLAKRSPGVEQVRPLE